MRPELLVAAVIVIALVGYGIAHGSSNPVVNCQTAPVSVFNIFGINFLLCVLLISGVFTYGASTLAFAIYVLATTGASVGSIVSRLGWEGVALMAPHGVFELVTWVIAVAVGLAQPMAHLPIRVRRALRTGSSEPEPFLSLAAKGIVTVAVVLLFAAALESIWTGWYGQRIVC